MLELALADASRSFSFPPGTDVMTIGRAESNQVAVDNPHVSAVHGQITLRDGRYVFQDLGSTNGSAVEREGVRTVVDGARTPELELRLGDRVLLGHEKEPVILVVTACDPPAATSLKGATLIATHRMGTARETGGRIEAGGGTLLPFLALAERLTATGDSTSAVDAFSDCVRQVVPAVMQAAVAEEAAAEEISITERPDGTGADISVPVDAGPGPSLCARLRVESGIPCGGDVDRFSLAATLLGARLRQLRLIEQLTSARARLATKNRYLRERAEQRATESMVGSSPAMQALRVQIQKVALSDTTVLITGPSGSGKELVAREIHRQSLRHNEIFAAVNCGALVENLLESELFGSKKGAFTGATRDREGLFEVAHGGTLFLDEIGDMSPALQVKLLRVLETGEVTPVGGTRTRLVDVRVLAATHRDLKERIRDGRFREDLYYRIHVFPIQVPPLGERREDVPALAHHFLVKYAEAAGTSVREISEGALRLLAARDFPGNVRQLANQIQRAVVLAQDTAAIGPEHLASAEDDAVCQAVQKAGQGKLREQMAAVEKVLIEEALAACADNRTHAARRLGITRQALLVKLNKYDIGR